MRKFNVGDVVYISSVGKGQYKNASCNPYDVEGVISEIEDGVWEDHQYCIQVCWRAGYYNSYRPVDLELVNTIVENE